MANPTDFPLRVVVDANLMLSMFLVRRNAPTQLSPKCHLISLLPYPDFRWLWTNDIISDYQRGAQAIEADKRIMGRALFDRAGFDLLLAALQLYPPVAVSATTLRAERRRIQQAVHTRDFDLDDAIYLACAVDGDAQLLTSQDSDLRSLGDMYEGIRIVNWAGLVVELKTRRLA